jgi:hypothetical protein
MKPDSHLRCKCAAARLETAHAPFTPNSIARRTSGSPSAGSSPPTSPTATGSSASRARARSGSTTSTDGGLDGFGEPALDDSLAGSSASTEVVCHSGAEGVTSEAGKADSSCNAVFAKLGTIPANNKALVMTFPDDHGTPALSSTHGVCAGPAATRPPSRSTPTTTASAGAPST